MNPLDYQWLRFLLCWRFRSLTVALSHVLPEASLQAFKKLVSFADYGFFVSWQRMEIPLPWGRAISCPAGGVLASSQKACQLRWLRLFCILALASKLARQIQKKPELESSSFLMFAERWRFELQIPFGGIHAFQACLLSHSSISPKLNLRVSPRGLQIYIKNY